MYERPLKDIKYIIVHHSVTPETFTVNDIRNIHLGEGFSDVGYHYLVTKDGVKPGRDLNFNGAHCIEEKEPYKYMNYYAVGICIVGDFSNNPPSDIKIEQTAGAIKRIADKLKIKVSRKTVIPHSSASYTLCPGPYTMEKIYRKLKI